MPAARRCSSASRSARSSGPIASTSVDYEPISVTTNKTPQEAVRGFGQSPTNFAIETAMDRVARHSASTASSCAGAISSAATNSPTRSRAAAPMTAATITPCWTRRWPPPDYAALVAPRDDRADPGRLAGIGISCCLEPSGGNSAFEPLFNPKNETTTWMEACQVEDRSRAAPSSPSMGTSTSGQGHETLVSTVVGEIARARSRDDPRRALGFARGAAEQQPGRQPHGDHAGRRRGRRGQEAEGGADRHRRA